ncbi:uncharacterized protein LOC126602932 [Malus sylvestris]|uniref:uncharacterized protein n=1 Tax=Malus domestica TaxID=3750 RepID=UPI00049914C9|nr:uncharacterized protein LOC103401707 [Malus domestica]XP_050125698.1 uncharacterized protein LOC126602932 [Malus sylvestris]
MAASTSDVFKVNVDGAISLKGLNIGVGVVTRNDDGALMAGCATQLYGYFDALTTELLAENEGLLFAYDAGFTSIILELDSKSIVDLNVANDACFDRDGTILKEIDILNKSISFLIVKKDFTLPSPMD